MDKLGDQQFSFKETIKFDIKKFSYIEGKDILNDISFQVNKGEFVVITGASGCGKTTLMSFLVNSVNTYDGNVLIDDVSVADIIPNQLYQNIAVVDQDEYLFNMSIRDNMLMSRSDASDTEIMKVISRIGAMDIISESEHALDTIVGEQGSHLSGGQRQKLGIARALIRDPEIIVLDEATNALDSKSERALISSIRSNPRVTLIAISHKPSLIGLADRIISVEGSN